MKAGLNKKVVVGAFLGVGICAATAGILLWETYGGFSSGETKADPLFESELGIYEKAAVSSDAQYCSEIGREVMSDGGNAVDAAIATLFCVGVVHTQSMGIGGGFLAVFYNSTEKKSYVLNAREKAPAAAFEDMFHGNPDLGQRGALGVAVPGELKGYWELYKKFGSGLVPWARLVQPAIKLCKEGFLVSMHTANALKYTASRIKAEPSMAEVFINNKTGDVFEENDRIRRQVLGQTLERIAREGGNVLYEANSTLMKSFVADLANMGGIIKEQDMLDYTVEYQEPIVMPISDNLQLHTVPPPGGGIILSFILKLLSAYEMGSSEEEAISGSDLSVTTHQRIVEAFKHAYAKRTYLGDLKVGAPDGIAQVEELVRNLTSIQYINSIRSLIKDDITNNTFEYYGAKYYQPENHGTSHVSVLGPNGDAISVTSTINLFFGAKIRSRSTGIIYNVQMDDFSAPNITNAYGVQPSPNNLIMPGKRPVSSMSPTIFTDAEGKVRLIIGASGGTRITSAIAYATIRTLWFNETIKEAIDARRIHHQLHPMVLRYEEGFPRESVKGLEAKEHGTEELSLGSSNVIGIARLENGTIHANSDFRKQGTVAGF